jgi:hypothetical protein
MEKTSRLSRDIRQREKQLAVLRLQDMCNCDRRCKSRFSAFKFQGD